MVGIVGNKYGQARHPTGLLCLCLERRVISVEILESSAVFLQVSLLAGVPKFADGRLHLAPWPG